MQGEGSGCASSPRRLGVEIKSMQPRAEFSRFWSYMIIKSTQGITSDEPGPRRARARRAGERRALRARRARSAAHEEMMCSKKCHSARARKFERTWQERVEIRRPCACDVAEARVGVGAAPGEGGRRGGRRAACGVRAVAAGRDRRAPRPLRSGAQRYQGDNRFRAWRARGRRRALRAAPARIYTFPKKHVTICSPLSNPPRARPNSKRLVTPVAGSRRELRV